MEEVVVKVGSKYYLVPKEIEIIEYEGDGRADGVTYRTDGKVAWGWYWTTSLSLDRCPVCGQHYIEYRNCGCDPEEEAFSLSLEEYVEIAKKHGYVEELPFSEGEARIIVQEIEEIRERIKELMSKIENIMIREVKEFGNSAHVVLPKDLIGRRVLIIPF